MDTTTQLLAILGTLLTGLIGGGSLVWKFMVNQIKAKDAEIKRLNDDRVRIALDSQATAGNYRQVVAKLTEVIRSLKITYDAQEE